MRWVFRPVSPPSPCPHAAFPPTQHFTNSIAKSFPEAVSATLPTRLSPLTPPLVHPACCFRSAVCSRSPKQAQTERTQFLVGGGTLLQ